MMKNLNGKNSISQNKIEKNGETQTRKRIDQNYENYKKELREMNLSEKAKISMKCIKREIAALVDTEYGKKRLNKHLATIEQALMA